MLDKRCFALLNVINSECNGSGYKIFSISELVSLTPIKLGLEREGISEALSSLAEHELISIKYSDENEICLRPLIKGRVAIENIEERELSEINSRRKVLLFAFLGGVFGGLLSSLIFFVIKLIGGA